MRYRLEDGSEKFIRRVYANDKFGNVRRIRRIYQKYNSSINLLFDDSWCFMSEKKSTTAGYGTVYSGQHVILDNRVFVATNYNLEGTNEGYSFSFPGGSSAISKIYRCSKYNDTVFNNPDEYIASLEEIPISGTISGSVRINNIETDGINLFVKYSNGQVFQYNSINNTLEPYARITGTELTGFASGGRITIIDNVMYCHNSYSNRAWEDYHIISWNGVTWSAFGPQNQFDGGSLTVDFFKYNNVFYAISQDGTLRKIVGSSWVTVGSGLSPNTRGNHAIAPDGKLVLGGRVLSGSGFSNVYTFDGAQLVQLGGILPYTDESSYDKYVDVCYDSISDNYIATSRTKSFLYFTGFGYAYYRQSGLFILDKVSMQWVPYFYDCNPTLINYRSGPPPIATYYSTISIVNNRLMINGTICSDTVAETIRDLPSTPNGFSDVTITMSGSAAGTKS
jgi:hypothetical protein